MTIISQISTHKAVKENGYISIYQKGFTAGELHFEDELLYTIPLDEVDDVFAIMERYEEDNRCNLAEFLEEVTV